MTCKRNYKEYEEIVESLGHSGTHIICNGFTSSCLIVQLHGNIQVVAKAMLQPCKAVKNQERHSKVFTTM